MSKVAGRRNGAGGRGGERAEVERNAGVMGEVAIASLSTGRGKLPPRSGGVEGEEPDSQQQTPGEEEALARARPRVRELPDPELAERPRRRRFTAEYKLRVLQQADACKEPGEVGALLRSEGLYSSHLSAWREQRDQGALTALSRPRGRRKRHRLETEVIQLRRRAERAEGELAKAHRVIEVQGKVSALLEEMLRPKSAAPDGSSEP